MKKLALFIYTALFAMAMTSSATLIWSDTFTQADGAFSTRAAETGVGNIEGAGTIGIVANAITITADGGSDRVEFESSAAGLAGVFQWDLSANVTTNSNSVFVQMVDGDSRSTGGSPLPNFAHTINANSFTSSTATVSLYFNVSGFDVDYTGPDTSAQTLPTGGFDYWIGNSLSSSDNNASNNGAGIPSLGVDTLVVQMFAQQADRVLTIDNASYNTFAVVPEPSSLALLLLGFGCLWARRR